MPDPSSETGGCGSPELSGSPVETSLGVHRKPFWLTSPCLFGGRHVFHALRSDRALTLALLVLRVLADHPNHPTAVDDFALVTNLLNRCPNLHLLLLTQ